MPRTKAAEQSQNMEARITSNGQPRVQMADIARLAGVSSSTVSRALSGSPLIPESTRNRIGELARSLNYRVNVGAANLRRKDVTTVGVVILGDSMQTICDPFVSSILSTVVDALDERGTSLLLTRIHEGHPQQLASFVNSGQVAGLIVIGQQSWHEKLNQLSVQGVPMAVWGACLLDVMYPVVGGDNLHGGYLATQHLLQAGCRHIAFFGDVSHPDAGLRHQGYAKALSEAGLKPDARLHQSFQFGDPAIREVIDRWLDEGHDFDAVFATSDVAAISLMGALSERGLAVPDKVRVVGYDDIHLSAHVHPSLTSVQQPTAEAGRTLVELLFETLQGRPRRTVTLPAKLIERESSR